MSEITYISEELVMEGNLDSAGSSVVVAGRFKGELRAKDVLLEANSIFDGILIFLSCISIGLSFILDAIADRIQALLFQKRLSTGKTIHPTTALYSNLFSNGLAECAERWN